jgi:hypothetical protein
MKIKPRTGAAYTNFVIHQNAFVIEQRYSLNDAEQHATNLLKLCSRFGQTVHALSHAKYKFELKLACVLLESLFDLG